MPISSAVNLDWLFGSRKDCVVLVGCVVWTPKPVCLDVGSEDPSV